MWRAAASATSWALHRRLGGLGRTLCGLHGPRAGDVLRVCVVGSGPAGCYTVQQLYKKYGDDVEVALVDRLPTPFGLVRSGVAPDHQDSKVVTNQFTRMCADDRACFLGNVTLGRDVSLQELQQRFHAVVLAYGCESDRHLGVPGEGARGVLAAREFVWWYNGHPDAADMRLDLAGVESVAVAGIGNVALDCARVLLRPPQQLHATDIAGHALEQLRRSAVKHVHLFARRGPVQAACTPKELKELCGLGPDVAVHAPSAQMTLSAADEAEMARTRMRRRVYEIISKAAAAPAASADKHLHFQFYRQPVELVSDASGAVTGVRVEHTRLEERPGGGSVVATGTGEHTTHPVQLVLKSIGYAALPVAGLPFDARRGVVPNAAGRVLQGPDGDALPGLYVCGWLKRGPTGIIGTNLTDAEETVDTLANTLAAWRATPKPGAAALEELLAHRGVLYVDWGGWRRIDDAELSRGAAAGRVRDKVVRLPEMLSLAEAA